MKGQLQKRANMKRMVRAARYASIVQAVKTNGSKRLYT